jgi:hypothetical protein
VRNRGRKMPETETWSPGRAWRVVSPRHSTVRLRGMFPTGTASLCNKDMDNPHLYERMCKLQIHTTCMAIRFITHSYSNISQITMENMRYSQSITVFTSHCMSAASNSGCSLSSTDPKPHLSATHSNISPLCPRGQPSDQPTNQPTN